MFILTAFNLQIAGLGIMRIILEVHRTAQNKRKPEIEKKFYGVVQLKTFLYKFCLKRMLKNDPRKK